ncbi:MAG: phosphonopyruvate decarboxylase [Lachnospiraceae bacterium]|nr:phosphonopyruvate decarboxylase [Lachnospiraceae bacterium]
MKAEELMTYLTQQLNTDYFSGVPDSLLKPFISEIMTKYGVSEKHMIAANEGNALALAAGHHLATGGIPCVYMQNSGQGNMLNPFASLMAPEVYRMPCVFIVGWRGEPGVKDEPQHVFQGEITKTLMELLKIETLVLDKESSLEELMEEKDRLKKILAEGRCIAFIIRKGALISSSKVSYSNEFKLLREDIIEEIVKVAGEDPIISTTGKASRELFEIREKRGESHQYDFLTVGSMGHASGIALEVALNKKESKVWCIDGDGAVLMHMGSMAVIGANAPNNLIHVLINNEAHETVGGMPTVSPRIDFPKVAEGCGYTKVYQVSALEELRQILQEVKASRELSFIEIKASLGAREDLGRPTTTAEENKCNFMEYLKTLS